MKRCEYCAAELSAERNREARFCCDRHRAAWHREHDPHGVVRSMTVFANHVVIEVQFKDEAALRFRPGEAIVLGTVAAPGIEEAWTTEESADVADAR